MNNGEFTTDAGVTEAKNGQAARESAVPNNKVIELEMSGETTTDDIENENKSIGQYIVRSRTAIKDFYRKHKKIVKYVFFAVLIMLYVAYFGYAMWYEFGSEDSIRLLWVTVLVVVCLILSIIWRFTHKNITTAFKKIFAVCIRHPVITNRTILGVISAFVLIFVIVDLAVSSKNAYNVVSVSGIIVYIILFFIFSKNPDKVNWRPVLWGLALQFLFAIIVLRWTRGYNAFRWLGDRVTEFLLYSDAGARFVFGDKYLDHFFAFQVLPTVVFFSAAISVLYHLGVMHYVITKVSWVMEVTMGTTAAESLSTAGNIFVGMTEAPLLIRPYINDMTVSELNAIMTGGFATIAGGFMAAYILFGVPANHLISASVMSAPAALAMAKLIYPETEQSSTKRKNIRKVTNSGHKNLIEALSAGASAAISMVANIAVNLIAFLGILAFINATLTWFGHRVGIPELTFQIICSYILWPFAVIMGIPPEDCRNVAQMIGTKTFLNEFIAYQELSTFITNKNALDAHIQTNGTWYWSGNDVILNQFGNLTTLAGGIISERSIVISTYALCGFANFGSMGILLGALKALAPHRTSTFSSICFRAMIAGNVACFMTACIAGLFYQGAG